MPEEIIDQSPSVEPAPPLHEPTDHEPPRTDGQADDTPWLEEPWYYTPCEAI